MLAPHVMKGDEVSSSNWWVGTLMNKSAEDWMAYWTGGQGVAVMTAMEDSGVLCSLSRLAKIGRVDFNRVMVLRTASNYSVPGKGDTAADLVAVDGSNNLSAFVPALEAALRVGSIVVDQLASHWALYESRPPSAIETRK
jgi:purine nucleoside permease